MADAVFSFELEGNGDAANEQADALEKLREKLVADTAALGEMNKAFRALKGSSHASGDGFKRLKDQIAAQKASIANAHSQFITLGGDFKKLKKPTEDAKTGFEQFVKSAKSSGGPLSKLTSGLEDLQSLGASGVAAAGMAAIAAGVLALAAAALVATAALLKFGIAMADAVRDQKLQLEGLTKVRNWYGLAADKADFLQDTISKVSANSALGRDQINGMAVSLYKAGLRGGSLQEALEGVATATSAAGEEQGAFYRSWFVGAARSGQATKKLADDIKARFGGVARAQLLSLGAQTKKLNESFQQLFSGLKIDGFLEALHNVTDLFSQNTFSGRALKTILETVFNPMIDFATGYGIYFKRFFQGLIIGAQLLVLGLLRLRNWFLKTFGDSEILKGIDKQKFAVYAGAAAVGALAGVVVGLAAAFLLLLSPFILVGYQVYKFIDSVSSAYDAVVAIDWAGAGQSIIDGIVNGIKNGIGRVVSTVKDLASAAKNAFRNAIDSHSPSKLFARIGVEMPRGAAVGVRAGIPTLRSAVDDMADQSNAAYADGGSPFAAAPAASIPIPPSPRSSGLPPISLSFTIQADSKTDTSSLVEQIRQIVRVEVPQVFEKIAIQLGAGVPV